MVEGITDAQIIERLQRLERNAAKLYGERTGTGFVEAQRIVNSL